MPRQEIHSDKVKIDQPPSILDPKKYEGDVVLADKPFNKDYMDELAFNEEPVTIRLEPSSDKNAATAFPVWVNGKGAEIFQNGRWVEMGYLPVGPTITVKRKVLEVIIRAKVDTIRTDIQGEHSERPSNIINRHTTAVHSFSVLEDRNPEGAAWMTEMRRRNM